MSAIIIPGQHTLLTWRCDDERDGFDFNVLQAMDGDFHLSVTPRKENPHREHFLACHSASLRIRMPMLGGGMHQHLWDGLSKAVRAERKEQKI